MRTLLLLGIAAIAAADDSAISRAMPKDQAEHVEKIASLLQLKKTIEAETNGLKKKEVEEKLNHDSWRVSIGVNAQARDKGIKGWAGVCKAQTTGGIRLDVSDEMQLVLIFDGMPENVRKVVRELKEGDFVRVHISADRKRLVGDATFTPKTAVMIPMRFSFAGSVVESVEKLPAK